MTTNQVMTDAVLFRSAEANGEVFDAETPREKWAAGTLVRPLRCKSRVLLPKGTRVLMAQVPRYLYWIAFHPSLEGWDSIPGNATATINPSIVLGGHGWARA